MSVRIVFLASAEQDLKDLKRYIVKNFGQDVWRSSYRQIKDSIDSLKSFPLAGTIPSELEVLSITQFRQLLCGMNRVMYEVRAQTIYIHIVCDNRKDMRSLLTRRLLRS